MRKTKQMLALGLSVAMVASMTACTGTQTGGSESNPPESEEQTTDSTEESGWANTGVTVEAGKGIDFEDGKSGFLAMNTVVAGSNEGEISVVDFNGSKAAKIEVADKSIGEKDGASTETPIATPYIAIDASSLLGDAITEVKSIELDLAVEYSNGEFYAVSGAIYAGNSGVAENTAWSVYLQNKNPKTISMTMETTEFSAEAANIFMVSLNKVAAPGKEVPTIYIDNIIFKDASGNALAVDTSVEFDEAGLGVIDWSNSVVEVMGETVLEGIGGETGTGWWPTQSNSFTFFEEIAEGQGYAYVDPSILTPGSIITIYFTPGPDVDKTWQMPYLRCQQWADYTNGDGEVLATYDNPVKFATTDFNPVLEKDEDGNILETSKINQSWTIVQISYDEIAEKTGDPEWPLHTQFMGVADMSTTMTIDKVTVGFPKTGDTVNITGATGSSSGWGQAVVMQTIKNDGGTFDPAIITPGTTFVVEFSATDVDAEQAAPLELICQSWTDGNVWAKVAPYACSENKAYFSYDDMVAAFGSDDFVGRLDAFIIGDCNSSLTVASVGYIPGE